MKERGKKYGKKEREGEGVMEVKWKEKKKQKQKQRKHTYVKFSSNNFNESQRHQLPVFYGLFRKGDSSNIDYILCKTTTKHSAQKNNTQRYEDKEIKGPNECKNW